jgi:ATP-binding cassette subfamily B protein
MTADNGPIRQAQGRRLVNALIGLGQPYLSATIGESLIADLRNALFNHMQRMGLRFFTQIKSVIIYSYGV